MPLEPYRHRRDFQRTPEPEGKASSTESGRLFIVQRHAARHLHDDLRLELDGVLKSWAVPKGVDFPPGEKHLAVHVEDHPIEYGSFEGVIPAGEYGGGTVMLWDRGEWEAEEDPALGYRKGKLSFRLHGQKLKGEWTLARMGGKAGDGGKNWLLICRSAEHKETARIKEDRSIVSGRTMKEIAAAREALWVEGRAVPGEEFSPTGGGVPPDPAALPGGRKGKQPERFRPQLATLVDKIPDGDDWLHEIKFDGYRLLCLLRDGRARLLTRNGKDWTDRFGGIVRELARLPLREAILDGEVVVLRPDGTTDFQGLQNALKGVDAGGLLAYYLFDIPFCQGVNLTSVPLLSRKEFLRQLLQAGPADQEVLRYSDHIRGKGPEVYRQACRFTLEGVVSKRADSRYEQKRTTSWLKSKCARKQEFVIGGYTDPAGSRASFGALLLGFFEKEGLIYAGRVGTGFNDRTLEALGFELRQREQKTSPFSNPPAGREARGVHWVRPELVAEIEYSEWTGDGRLRHPSFKGLREDMEAREVGREKAAAEEPVSVQEQGAMAPDGNRLAGVELSNPDRILYPERGITKKSLAEYYGQIGDFILPYVIHRPLTLVRCPQGHHNKCFYQKNFNETLPPFIRGVPVGEKEGDEGIYLAIDDLPGLISLVQLGVLEIHPWGSREDRLDRPDQVIFDLDPGAGVEWQRVIEGALVVRDFLAMLGLESFVKTSGGKGLHVVAPLSPRRSDWEEVKSFARAVAEWISRTDPGRYLAEMNKARRRGRIYIDYLRNGRGATSIAPYSTRARSGAPVSTPLFWDELSPAIGPDHFTIDNLPARLKNLNGDPWEGFFEIRQSIAAGMRRKLGL